ncbi:glycosyltransferase involved in cell wall biosynthesis [Clostridium tetanomorphum]|uniref:Glycosyltransferase family 2 protein n=1 Tax=Clostridium tetanomorphum TaxID=1553 RepID=A0A923E725_CLOTT|nr:glycosyltransferase family 2 protein [Clostridium tetanomorphum]KAJ51366.1 family 2 glycosyl transferase [Clostridium tetanomorphum DSM 665]MBC2396427.1 glycosyltransferase family 2 protein [Clostridium tetanomorphum]MBP1863343.1 glycosyltransferase involved in cell wall biosynthesis [Clostridium tetanomorphum]NRS83440.1 glycosyltransferase involved in cell wall biosynthesis [Clostridium tetanomorphum]NRZ96640.1 glycosyltransferase involved in cell wall biosynthesis [Clostridium tetanomorph
MISLCMIVKNEEDNLDRCLKSIEGIVDQIIIVDTGSTDSTVNIAQKYTDEIYYYKWDNDFSAARNFSLEKAKGDWILLLDGDDEVPEEYKNKILELTSNKNIEGYFFKTINFLNSSYNNKDVIVNSNFRLFQNKPFYRFSGRIHEQLASNIKKICPEAILKTEDIEIYHYGYLQENVEKKNKRQRNLKILEEEIKASPNDPFTEFNLASEYYSLRQYDKAIPLYIKAMTNCSPNLAYYTKIIIRLTLCFIETKLYEKAYDCINTGLKYYNKLSDFYYLRSLIHLNLSKPTLAIDDLNKCIEYGEPPQEIAFFSGVGSYLSYERLANIYSSLEDYEKCLDCCYKTLNYNSNINIIYLLVHCLYKLNLDKNYIRNTLNKLFGNNLSNSASIISHILVCEKDYALALEYCNVGLNSKKDDKLFYLKGLCEFKLFNFNGCLNSFSNIVSDAYKEESLLFKFLSYIKLNKEDEISNLLNEKSKVTDICKCYYLLINSKEVNDITDDENESIIYSKIIFKLLDILLEFEEYDNFEKALELLNLINDNTLLLKLGKLYFKYEKYNLSMKELLRSINLMNVMDGEGANILNKLYLRM